jgi:hypothetical protein
VRLGVGLQELVPNAVVFEVTVLGREVFHHTSAETGRTAALLVVG